MASKKKIWVLVYRVEDEGQTEEVFPYLFERKEDLLPKAEKLLLEYGSQFFGYGMRKSFLDANRLDLKAAFRNPTLSQFCINDGNENIVFEWYRCPVKP